MNKKYTSVIIFGILILATAGFLGYSIQKKDNFIAPYTIPVATPVSVTKIPGSSLVIKSVPDSKETKAETYVEEKIKTPATNLSITVVAGETKVGIPYIENETFYSTLVSAQKSGLITFAGREYSGLGFFVSDIGDLHTMPGKNLLYYINGKEASVGVSTYIPKNGDVVEWRLN